MPRQDLTASEIMEKLADQYTNELRRGESPSINDYADLHPQLAQRIKTLFPLLEMMEREASALGTQAVSAEPETPSFERLGDFQIVREIGRGGMGIVYQAIQESLGRTVALKLLPQLALDSRMNQRFQQEARLAAMLHHTNIVPIYGIGAEGGYSYFVMQFIEGTSLDQVLIELRALKTRPEKGSQYDQPVSAIASALHRENSSIPSFVPLTSVTPPAQATSVTQGTLGSHETTKMQLSTTQLSFPNSSSTANLTGNRHQYWQNIARIGVQVADGLAHAHTAGIWHRDIKPSNLLLDEVGSVWITDFGLARLTESSHLTRTGEVVGTLRYLPPEQLSGQADQRGDIYGLGVTLYELTTLQPAFSESDPRKLMNQVADSNPVAPRLVDPQIPRDLETIILKSMAAEPDKRYQTADDLAADLRRFLAGQPVLARRIGAFERIWKWARRHPTIATLSVSIVLLTLAGLGGVTWKWREADANFRRAQVESHAREIYFTKALEAVDQMLNRVGSELLADQPGTSQIRQGLLTEALAFYDDFLNASGNDPTIQAEIGQVHRRMAQIHRMLGESDRALDSLQLAEKQFLQLHQTFPDRIDFLMELGEVKNDRALIELSSGRSEDAERFARAAIAHAELARSRLDSRLVDESAAGLIPGRLQAAQANLLVTLGTILATSRDGSAAIQQFEQAKQLFSTVPDAGMTDDLRQRAAQNLDRLAQFYVDLNRWDEAIQLREEAVQILSELVTANPQYVAFRDTLANVRQRQSGLLMRMGRTDQGLQALKIELDEREAWVREFGELPSLQQSLARNLALYATGLNQAGQIDQADAALERSLSILRDLTTRFPDNLSFLVELGYVTQTKATNLTMRRLPNETDQAADWSRQAYELRRKIVDIEPENAAYRVDLATAARTYSTALFAQDSREPILVELCQEAVVHLQRLVNDNPDNIEMLYQLAFSQLNLSNARSNLRQDNAIAPLEQAIATFMELIELRPQDARDRLQATRAYDQLARLHYQAGQLEDWEQTLRDAHGLMEETVEKFGDDVRLIQFLSISQNRLAHCLKVRGAVDEAIRLFEESLKRRGKELETNPENLRIVSEIASGHRNLTWANGLFMDPPDLDAALAHAQAGIALEPENPSLLIARAYVDYQRHDWDSLTAILESPVLNDASALADEYRMVAEAMRALAAAHHSDPENAMIHRANAIEILESPDIQEDDLLHWIQPELFRVVDHMNQVLNE